MAFRQTGVRATVQGFSRFMNEIKRMSDAQVNTSKKIAKAMRDETIRRDELTLAIQKQEKAVRDLENQLGKAFEADEARVQLRKLNAELDDTKDSLADLASAAASIGGGGGLSGLVGGMGGALGGAAGPIGLALGAVGLVKQYGIGGLLSSLFKLIPGVGLLSSAFKALAGIAGKLLGVLGTLAGIVLKVAGVLFNLARAVLGVVINAIKGALSAVVSLAGALLNFAGGIIQSAIGAVFDLAGALAGVVGKSLAWAAQAAGQALQAFGSALSPLIKEAWAGAEAFQRLSIRFQGLVANELKAKDETLNFNAAMEQALPISRELLSWMQQLAVTTPFSRRDISETMAFSMAMGFTANQAQELTLAIGEFVSGMGLESEVMERIILQFGQMQAGGRLYGTELRDLARGAFVPVNDILEKVAGTLDMTAKEWQDLAARGETDIQPFFDEFIRMANERFPNAMERMNSTLTAVKQNFHDFVTEFVGVRALGPALEAVSKRLNEMLEGLLSPQIMAAFGALGKHIKSAAEAILNFADVFILSFARAGEITAPIMDKVTGRVNRMARKTLSALDKMAGIPKIFTYIAAAISLAVDEITKAFTKTDEEIGNFADNVKQTAVNAFKWGFNIITQLAMGIVRGAATALTTAMNFISGMLASWLAPGSPPRIAPDLPEWGAAALQEWLHGMTEADFTILEAIQSPMRQALGIMEQMGVITRNEIGPLFAEFSKALAEGFAGGGLDPALLDSIRDSFDEFGEEIVTLIQAQYDLAEATRAVEDAEESLEDARKRHTEATADVAREITEYNRMLRGDATSTELAAQRELINRAVERRDLAADDIDAADEQLNLAKEQQDEAQDQLKLQESILNQLLAIAQAQYDITEETGRTGGAAGGLAEAIEEVEEEINKIGGAALGAGANLESAFEEARKNIQEAWSDLWAPVVDQWNEDVQPGLDQLATTFNNFKTSTIEPFMMALGIMPTPPDNRHRPDRRTPDNSQQQTAKGLKQAFDDIGSAIASVGELFEPEGAFGLLKRDFLWLKDEFLPVVPGMVAEFAAALGIEGLHGVVTQGLPTWQEFTDWVEEFTEEGGLWDTWMEKLEGVTTWLLGTDKSFGDEIQFIKDQLLPNFNELLDSAGQLLGTIAEILGINTEGDDQAETVNSGLGRFLGWIDSIIQVADSVIDFLQRIAGAFNAISDAIGLIAAAWANAPQWLKDLLTVANILRNPLGSTLGSILPPYQHGAWEIPSNTPAFLHAGEMVLPRSIANQIRAMASAPVAAPAVVPQNTINFGDINVSDNLSWAEAKARTERMVGGLI